MGRHYHPNGSYSRMPDPENTSPLAPYNHLIPNSYSGRIIDQHIFLTNVSILFPTYDPSSLRLTIGKTGDIGTNPRTFETTPRDLYYAALVVIPTVQNDSPPSPSLQKQDFEEFEACSSLATRFKSPTAVLLTGPALAYTPPLEAESTRNTVSKSFSSFKQPNPDSERELASLKERTISMLMVKAEELVHERMVAAGAKVEVLEPKIPPEVAAAHHVKREGSVKSIRRSGWFGVGAQSGAV